MEGQENVNTGMKIENIKNTKEKSQNEIRGQNWSIATTNKILYWNYKTSK